VRKRRLVILVSLLVGAVVLGGATLAVTSPREESADAVETLAPTSSEEAYLILVAPVDGGWSATPVAADELAPDPADGQRFATVEDAIEWAERQPSQYGVRVAPPRP